MIGPCLSLARGLPGTAPRHGVSVRLLTEAVGRTACGGGYNRGEQLWQESGPSGET
jgi:hypothetical protein